MTALACTRCGDTSLTVEAAAEYVRYSGRLPACACEHGTRAAAAIPSRGCWVCVCAACRDRRDRQRQQQQAVS